MFLISYGRVLKEKKEFRRVEQFLSVGPSKGSDLAIELETAVHAGFAGSRS